MPSTQAVPARHLPADSNRPSESALVEHLKLASRVAAQAVDILGAERAKGRTVRATRGREVKVAADETINQMICQELSRHSPFGILSEESGISRGREPDSPYRWVVDPLDGSANFSRGIPLAVVSIALWRGMTPLLGVIHDIERAERFEGIAGQGARLNAVPIHVSEVRVPEEAVVCTGFPTRRAYDEPSLSRTVRQIQRYQKIRMLGSAALSLAYVACGRADVYEEERIALWDIAAGAAIVQAAGGCVRMSEPDADQAVTLRAGNSWLVRDDASDGSRRVAAVRRAPRR